VSWMTFVSGFYFCFLELVSKPAAQGGKDNGWLLWTGTK
jgi:hypothetical protein